MLNSKKYLQTNRIDLDHALPPATDFIQAEKPDWYKTTLEKLAWSAYGFLVNPWKARNSHFKPILKEVKKYSPKVKISTDEELRGRVHELRFLLRSEGFTEPLIGETFAIIQEASVRTLGMSHFDSQILGGRVILAGMIAEMKTGEGKTLAATLPAATAAIAGFPVHVISVNDYLTQRDAEEMGPLYRFLELTVGCVTHEVPHEERKQEYECDITYCSNKDLTFDYLRDRMVLKTAPGNIMIQSENLYHEDVRQTRLMQRGLHFAILDEADSVLVDDARTPLIVSASLGADSQIEFMAQAQLVAGNMIEGQDFHLDIQRRLIFLTNTGRQNISDQTSELGSLWVGKVRREEVIHQALTATYLFLKDEHYIVSEDKVQIIDENTGRVMPDRSWERGLHQLIELKEGCEPTQQRETLAKMSYQRFFSRYLFLSGMTGTAQEVSGELWGVYGLTVVKVPPNKPSKLKKLKPNIVLTEEDKWREVVSVVKNIQATGSPTLVGTRSVAASEHLCALLDKENLSYRLLNAKQDFEEALIIAEAGRKNQITIATNMAGRGTDIKLDEESKSLGGLHVILTERFEAGRIDRQLAGRCARQGDPGVYQEILALSDLKEISYWIVLVKRLAEMARRSGIMYADKIGFWALKVGQKKRENINFKIRKKTLSSDEKQNDLLSFSGRFE